MVMKEQVFRLKTIRLLGKTGYSGLGYRLLAGNKRMARRATNNPIACRLKSQTAKQQ
jgi:hypothetical protein